jgi:hypothetical protein
MRATICVGYAYATAAFAWILFREIPATSDLPGWYPLALGWIFGICAATYYTRGER